MIKKEEIRQMADLAMLKFSEEELDDIIVKLTDLVRYGEQLNEVDTEGVEPTFEVTEHPQPLREDVVEEGLTREEVLQNSIEDEYGYFKILKIVE